MQHIKLCEQKAKEYIVSMLLGEYAILVINSVDVLESLRFLNYHSKNYFIQK